MEPDTLQIYQDLYDHCTAPDLYTAPWWLDATCGPGGWKTWIQYDASGLAQAALPYGLTRIRGMSALITPPFTQWVALIKRPGDVIGLPQDFMSCLPQTSIRDLSIKPEPLILAALQKTAFTLRYSYIIPAAAPGTSKGSGYNEGLKRNIRQAREEYMVSPTTDIDVLLSLCSMSYKAQGLNVPSWQDRIVPVVVHALWARNAGEIMVAESGGNAIAAILVGWDRATSYYLAGGRIPGEAGASAHALLLDQAVIKAADQGRAFDFEGSMQAGIANFFQSFGAVPSAYWNFRRYRGLGRIWSLLK